MNDDLSRPGADSGPVVVRPWQPGDDEAVLRCHNTVFSTGTDVPARTLALWRWKFLANPTGHVMQMLAAHANEGVVGVYPSIPVAITTGGRRRLAAQAVDVCVRSEWLRHGDPGLFPRLGRAFAERWVGSGAGQALFTYGLPVNAWRSGSLHLGWQNVRDWDITYRELPTGAAPRPVPADLAVQRVARFGDDADALFARIEPTLGLAAVRDQRYLNWRYADHPECSYALFECRERGGGALRGLCVYGTGDVLRPHTSYLVDWLQHADDRDTMAALLGAVEAQAQADGTGLVCSTWNHADDRFLMMQDHGYRVRGSPYFLVTTSSVYDIVFFREQWYFTLGDSDLV